jgi:hypothetical protein
MPKGLRPITTYNVFEGAQIVTAALPITSVAFDLRECAQNGLFSLDYVITVAAGGTLAFTYTVCSTKAGTYFTPTGGGSIVSGLGATTGGLPFEPEMYPFMKIVATATTNTCTATVHLNIQ